MEPKTDVKNEFTSAKGIGIPLRAVSQFKLNDLLSSKTIVPKPTYEAKNAAKEVQLFELDAQTAAHKGRMDDWNAYLVEAKKAEAEYSEKFSQMMIWDGVDIEVPGPDSDWQRECDHFGIKVPTEPIARKISYVFRELLAGPEDLTGLIADILEMSQLNKEAVDKIRNSFRDTVQKTSNRGASKDKRKLEDEQPALE